MSRAEFVADKRSRVLGEGPKRQLLPNFYHIETAPQEILDEILSLVDEYSGVNDIYGNEYAVSKYCDLRKNIAKNHINLLLQKPELESSGMDQKTYTRWDKVKEGSSLKKYLNKNFPNCYRTRIAILPPGEQIDWHIDINTTVSCRFQLLVKNSDFVFEVNRKGKISKIPFQEGQINFTNTAYTHRVYNPTDRPRVSLLFDIDYMEIAERLPLLKK